MAETLDKNESSSVESGGDKNFEAQASKMGWVPEDKFRGDPEKWVDAETFVKRGEEVLPIVKAQLRKTEAELAELRQAAGEWQRMNEQAFKRQEEEWKARLAEVTQAKKDAVAQGDGEKFEQAEAAERELRDNKPEAPKKAEVKTDPEFKSWLDENPWYGKDRKKTLKANLLGAELAVNEDGTPALQGRALYDAVARELEAQERASTGTTRAGAQRGGRPAASTKGARTYENLQPEFQKACDRMVRTLGIKKEQYVASCDEDAFRS